MNVSGKWSIKFNDGTDKSLDLTYGRPAGTELWVTAP